ncbi:carboxypeptidase-like regulatory domain-containing protein [Acidicapsa dinghuensis]|uniref:Carboxypeptidase-like regulatory domain-containing protein n=1 Tax=Acidicapsa dinghuensis TaxID=2218256 RepID=A0ABW1EGM1_9BACT|nr:carboxypeptidase-like regulatory domain-containing protein [Acidicapsa dinghuensis]
MNLPTRYRYGTDRLRYCSKIAFKVLSIAAAGIALGITPGASFTWGSSHVEPSIVAPEAEAQNFGQRVIQGKVLDDSEQAVVGATVFLENVKSRDVKSFTTPQSGSFRFAQVGMVDDYQVWAEKGKKKSSVKTISSFDSRKEVDFDLHLK